jgi:hypothetical protein
MESEKQETKQVEGWARQWNSYVKNLTGLCWMPNRADGQRVMEIQKELYAIIERNDAEGKGAN